MLFIELFVPKGTLSLQERQGLAERLTPARLFSAPEGGTEHITPDTGVGDLFASLSHVVVHEPETWIAAAGPGGRRHYVVNVHVAAWAREIGEHLIAAITRELAEADARGAETQVLVHVLGVPEGGYGIDGQMRRSSDLLEMIEQARTEPPAKAPPGTFIDPVCGARVPVETAVVLEREGTTYGFCCSHCRGHFAKRSAPPR